jgi:hypothetical protein
MADGSVYDPVLWGKLEARAIPEPNSGCLLWLDAINQDGYGSVGIEGTKRTTSAHRRTWFALNGPIPAGKCVCHKCDVRSCISPQHLFLDTHAGNMADRNRKGRAKGGRNMGSKSPMSKLTEDDVRAIRVAAKAANQRIIAKRFGVHFGTVNDILMGKTWKHLV